MMPTYGTATRQALVSALVTVCAFEASQASADWGDLKMRFVYDGTPPTPQAIDNVCSARPLVNESLLVDPKSHGIANVVVYAVGTGVKVHPSYEATAKTKVVVDNKDCRFDPHVTVLRLSQPLEFHNSDAVGHNANFAPLGGVAINPLLPAGGAVTYTCGRVQKAPQPLTCNIHGWMKAHILPLENPYATVSATDGMLELKSLPAGELEFQAWHEKRGYLALTDPTWDNGKFKVTIKPGTNDLGTVKVPPAMFQ